MSTNSIVGLDIQFKGRIYSVGKIQTDGADHLVALMDLEQLGQDITLNIRKQKAPVLTPKDKVQEFWEWKMTQKPVEITEENFGIVAMRSDHAREFALWMVGGVADKINDMFSFLPSQDTSYDPTKLNMTRHNADIPETVEEALEAVYPVLE